MNETQKDVVLLSFIECLKDQGSWCGETHIQKGTYFLQELTGVPLSFDYILYKHGPYSFDLKTETTSLLADGLLAIKPRPPYGPSMRYGENAVSLLERYPKTRELYRAQAEFVAERIGKLDVNGLERLATALYVTRRDLPNGNVKERAARIHELKPHVTCDLAHDAVIEVDDLIKEAEAFLVSPE